VQIGATGVMKADAPMCWSITVLREGAVTVQATLRHATRLRQRFDRSVNPDGRILKTWTAPTQGTLELLSCILRRQFLTKVRSVSCSVLSVSAPG